MSLEQGSSVAGLFWSLSPVVVISSSWNGNVNAQVAVTVVTSSVVHSMPRLIVGIWKRNFTHQFIYNSKSLTIHLLREDQLGLVKKYGFVTGREVDKLKDVDYTVGTAGSPILADVHSYVECRVLNAMDGGDMTVFLVGVIDGKIFSGDSWMTLDYFYRFAPQEWLLEYGENLSESVDYSMKIINNISYTPWNPD